MNQRRNETTTAIQRTNTDEAIALAMEACGEIVETSSVQALAAKPAMIRTIQTSAGVNELRRLLSDDIVRDVLMPLMGSRLGFKTDRDDKPDKYGLDVVREVAIEAMMRGFLLTGNEVNIIGGNAYFTKEAFERAIEEFPGVSDLKYKPGVPHVKETSALIPYWITYVLDGEAREFICDIVEDDKGRKIDLRIPARVNKGMGLDAILGKARRKVCARLYEELTGVKTPDGDLSDGDAMDAEGHTVSESSGPVKSQAERIADRHGSGPRGETPTRQPGEEG